MNKKTKKRMLMLSFVFLVLWATATWASNDVLKVQSILGTAIQDIQKIYFSSWAVKDPAHPETEILMNLQNGSVHMWGRMMMAISWANDRMGKLSTWSSLFQGRNNTLSWANSFLVWWSWNTIEQDATWSAILWGTSNKIIKGIASYILWGNKNTISGDNSFIIGGVNNKIEWNNSYIFGFTGVKINANNSVAFWKNIEIEKDNVFMWNGTTNKESASRENTFVMYAKNWLIIKDASNITVTKNNSTWALNVADWIMQISWEAVHCWPAIEGAIQYTWWAFGCFCGCNGTGWVSMTPTQKCRNLCPTIDGFSWDGALCKYTSSDERESLTKAEACEAWNSSDIEDVTSSYFWEDYVSGWQWTCEDSLWGDTVSCSTKRKLVKGRCWSTLNSCAWEWVLDTTSIRFVNHKNIRECLPVWYPVYWVEGWWETNTKQICSLCEDGYKNLKDASGNWIKDSDWSIKCFKIEGTSCKNDVTITTDWNVWCTSWGVAKSTSTDANWNKTWNCESPTGEVWEKFCHTCNASANYVWSWWTTNKCVLKKSWVCANTWASTFAVNNQSTWCTTVWWITWAIHDWNTYKWYCKWENGWDNSPLCNYCAGGTEWDWSSESCVSKSSCLKPTITEIDNDWVYFDLHWQTWSAVSILYTADNNNWPSGIWSVWSNVSPRIEKPTILSWYMKIANLCSWSWIRSDAMPYQMNGCWTPTISSISNTWLMHFSLSSAWWVSIYAANIVTYSNTGALIFSSVAEAKSPRNMVNWTLQWTGVSKIQAMCNLSNWASVRSHFASKNYSGSSMGNSCSFPTMVIDKVENCAIKYHFNGPDPISWKSCCTAARLDRSLDWETWWWPLTTVYGSPLTWSRVWNNWDSGMIYLRYTYSWCNGEFSPVISYNMPVQSGCPTTPVSYKKTFHNGKCLNWTVWWLYKSDASLVGEISWWWTNGPWTDYNWTHHYWSYQKNDFSDWYVWTPNVWDFIKYEEWYSMMTNINSYPATLYIPWPDNKWNTISIDANWVVKSVATHIGTWNLYSTACW